MASIKTTASEAAPSEHFEQRKVVRPWAKISDERYLHFTLKRV